MSYFEYPLNTKALYRKKAEIKRRLSEQEHLIHKKIAVLGGSTTSDVIKQLDIFLLYYGISAEFYESQYGQYWQDAVFGNQELDSFQPDIIYVHTSWRNIESFPQIKDTKTEVEQMLEAEIQRFKMAWKSLNERFHCPVIQNNFDRPNYRLFGNRDIWDYRGRSNFISRLNQAFYEYAQEHKNFYINDLEFISQDYGLSEWGSSLYWHMYKYAMCMDAIPYVAQSVANIIKSIYGKNKKVLALDLDNTLWGGVVGDDGIDNIKIGPEESRGQVYLEFQEYCKKLQEIGVLLAVNSKNEMENAMEGLRHPSGLLRPEDFVNIKANWNAKDQNIREMASELSLGTDSFVFADDNPAERELVSGQLQEVAVPLMDKAENYIKVLDHSGYFETTVLSEEDLNKTKQYQARTAAGKSAAAFADYGEYLESLEMTAVINSFESGYIQRITQLINKSNQFNLTTLRLSEEEVRAMQEDEKYICLCGRLIDRFGDNGLVTVVIGEKIGNQLHIRLWLMSCRVLKRGMEDAMMNVLVKQAAERGVAEIIGYYYPTKKNKMVGDFYDTMCYQKISEEESGSAKWKLEVGKYKMRILHMAVINEIYKK